MADIEANIGIGIDTSNALAAIKQLQRQISTFQKELQASSAANAASAQNLQRALISDINATGKFSARLQTIRSATESFTNALEKNKLSMGEYFRYAAASTRSFGQTFATEFNTIEKVAESRVKTLQTQYISLGRDASGALKSIAVRPLSLDMNDLATRTAMAAQKQQIFNQLLKQGSTNLLNFGKNTQWAGRQLMVGFTIPLSIFATTAAKTFMQMEEQALRFKRVYGELFTTEAETNAMAQQIQDLALEFTKYGVAVEQTMSLAADAAAMGNMGADLTAQVAEATRLAVLGQVEQQQALETTVSLTNAFGIAAADLTEKIDFLNAVENQTVTSIEDLTIAIPKAGPVVKQLGGDVEDLAFFLTAMKEGGINASEGANALKSGLASLINPTDKAAEMLLGFGINIKAIVEANKGNVSGLVVEFAKALETLDPTNRARAIEQLFGKFQFARLSTLFQNVIAEGTQAERVLSLANATTEELAQLSSRELGRLEESTSYRFQKVIADIQAALAPIGEDFLKVIIPVVEFANKILDAFNSMDAGVRQFVVGAVAVLAGLGPVLIMTFGLLANGVANALKGFAFLRERFLGLGGQSTVLGEQLQYMTQEQLEAAAVAASLDQVHSNLIQRFSAERETIDALTAAYRRNASALAALRGTAIPTTIASSPAPRKMKDGGIVMVPGSGKGDKVPAMLEPGEAVIPGKMVEKYAGLINGMIAGTIPGYQGGKTVDVGSSGKTFEVFSTRSVAGVQKLIDKMLAFGNTAEDVAQMFEEMQQSGIALSASSVARESKKRGMGGNAGAQIALGHLQMPLGDIESTGERKMGSLVRRMLATQNKALDAGGQTVERFSKDWKSISGGLVETVKLGGLEITDGVRKATQQLDDEIHDIAVNLANSRGVRVTDTLVSEATDQAMLNARARGGTSAQVAGALQATKSMEVLAPGTVKTLKQAGIMLADETFQQLVMRLQSEGKLFQDGKNFKVTESGKDLVSKGDTFARINEAGVIRPTGRQSISDKTYLSMEKGIGQAELIGAKTAQAYNAGAEKEMSKAKDLYEGKRKRRSPHPLAPKDGADDAKAYDTAAEKASRSRRASSGGNITVGTESGRFVKDPKSGNIFSAEKFAQQELAREKARTRATQMAITSMGNFASKLQGLTFAASALAGILSAFPGPVGEVGSALFQLSGVIFGLITATQLLITAKMREAAASAISQIGGAGGFFAGKGSKVGNLFGNIGKVFSAMLPNLVRFIPVIGAAVTAIGAFTFVMNIMKEQEEKIRGLGNAAFVSGEKLKAAGEAFGFTAKTGNIAQGFQGTASVSPEAQAQASAMAATEEFNTQWAEEIKAIQGASKDQADAILYSLAQQLSVSGAPAAAVEAILKAITIAAGKKDLDLSFASINFATDNAESATEKAVKLLQPKPVTGSSPQVQTAQQKKENAAVVAGAMASDISSINIQLTEGAISADEFNAKMADITASWNTLDQAGKELVLPDLIAKFGPEAAATVDGIKNVEDSFKLLQAAAAGLDPTEIQNLAAAIKEGQDSSDPAKTAAYAKAQQRLDSVLKTQAKTTANLVAQKKQQAALDAAKAEVDTATAAIQADIDALAQQTDAYNDLINKGWSAADALLAVKDANFMAAYSNAVNATSQQQVIDKYKELINLIKTSPVTKTTTGGGGAKKSPFEEGIEGLQNQRKELLNTSIAYKKLTSDGMNAKQAFDAVQDPATAAALAATKVGTKGWERLVSLINQTNKLAQNKAIKELLRGTKDETAILRKQNTVTKALEGLGYSYEDIQRIISDETALNMLSKDLKDGKLNAKDTLSYLEEIKKQGKLDILLNLKTKEGAANEFQKLYDKAVAFLNEQKVKVELDFEVATAADQDIIEKAEDRIADLQDDIDDFEAELSGIEEQEDQINKQYEVRQKALDSVQKANDKIARQQKGQLSVAEALSSGDIAAAARAAQELEDQNRQDAFDAQREALERSKEQQLASLTSANGRTRSQIEAEIKNLKKEIFDIEEKTLEPARERIRLQEITKREAVQAIDAQIREWDILQNKVNLAKLKLTPEEMEAMKFQAGLIKDLLENWDKIEDKEAILKIIKQTIEEDGGSGEPPVVEEKAPVVPTTTTTTTTTTSSGPSSTSKPGSAPTGVALKTTKELNAAVAASQARTTAIDKSINSRATQIKALSASGGPTNKAIVEALQKQNAADAYTKSWELKAQKAMTDKAKEISKPTVNTTTLQGILKASGINKLAYGGMVKRFINGGFAMGSDTVPAMLTPGEFVINRPAVRKFGVDNLKAINSGSFSGGSVYNYSVNVSVQSGANPDQIARTIVNQIRQIDSQRIRSNRF